MTTITAVSLPNAAQADEIRELVRVCGLHDRTSLSFPLEDGMMCWLAYRENRLCAALSLLLSDGDLWECRAFTAPEFRKQGLFSALLDQALEAVEQPEAAAGTDIRLCFPADPHCRDTLAVLEALEAEFWYSEYMMECLLTEESAYPCPPDLELSFRPLPGTDGFTCTAAADRRTIGTCTLYPHGSSAFLCQVLVPEPLRNRGYGTLLIRGLQKSLALRGVPAICLQVSGDNEAALALYKKTGFQITETLSCYLF